MTNTRREALLFTAISAEQLNAAMDACASRRKVLILDCCYSGAFPAGRQAKSDEGVQTLERFQGKGRAVLTASDATQYAFEGDDLTGAGTSSVFTRHLVEAIRSGAADLDEDGDIALDELYSYVREQVVAEVPQQRPKKQEDVDGRIIIARNVHWHLPDHLRYAIESPISAQRLSAVEGLGHLHRVGNDAVRSTVAAHLTTLAADDSRTVSAAATALLERLAPSAGRPAPLVVPVPRTEPALEPPAAVAAPVPAAPVPAAPVPAAPVPAAPVPAPAVPAPVSGPPHPVKAPRKPRWPVPATVILGLVACSALPLTLARLQLFETGNSQTADEFSESTVPWTLLIVLPLVAAVALLAARARFPRTLPVAFGLVLGAGLTLVEHAAFWVFFFAQNGDSYTPGPALLWLVAGAAVVAAAGIVVLTRTSLAGRPPLRRDWRVACAVVVVAGAAAFLSSGLDTATPWGWPVAYAGTVILAVVALGTTLLWLRSDQRTAALVAVTLFGVWSVYFPVQELLAPRLYLAASLWETEIASVVVTVLACYVAQAGTARRPAASTAAPR
jgi:hypothetical protein